MTAEPIIAFLLLRDIRRILRTSGQNTVWRKRIKILLYAIVCLFVADLIFHIEFVTKWIWHALLICIIGTVFLKKEFNGARTLMFAVLPFAVLSFFTDLFKLWSPDQYKSIEDYLDIAIIFSIVWMVAMVFVSRKQQKALQKEHEKTQQEEEQRKWMAARKAELEQIVVERTSELRQQKEQVENTLTELKSTQAQLIQSEKMASLGELTAGIAHEIQNPLNFVNNFSEVNKELLIEMKEEIERGNLEEVKVLANSVMDNQEKINHHGRRADAIVKGMLQHSRRSSGAKEPTDINILADEYLRLAYHGLRAKDKSFNAKFETDFDANIGKINLIPQEIGRVILNLINNAFYAARLPPPDNIGVNSKRFKDPNYKHEPTVWVNTKKDGNKVLISIRDNGPGIPQKILDKIFQPFFTTKPTGQGTGLGLSLSYDIIKAHGGEIKVETEEGQGTEFIIQLPAR